MKIEGFPWRSWRLGGSKAEHCLPKNLRAFVVIKKPRRAPKNL
jgi:hypothetical protein